LNFGSAPAFGALSCVRPALRSTYTKSGASLYGTSATMATTSAGLPIAGVNVGIEASVHPQGGARRAGPGQLPQISRSVRRALAHPQCFLRIARHSRSLSFFGRPPLRPRAWAEARPARVRSRMIDLYITNLDILFLQDTDITATDNGFEAATEVALRRTRYCTNCDEPKLMGDFWPGSLFCKACTVLALRKMRRAR
jgi:hypothetical protein